MLLLFAVLVVVRFVRFEIGTLGVILCMNFELMLKRCNANKNYVRRRRRLLLFLKVLLQVRSQFLNLFTLDK